MHFCVDCLEESVPMDGMRCHDCAVASVERWKRDRLQKKPVKKAKGRERGA